MSERKIATSITLTSLELKTMEELRKELDLPKGRSLFIAWMLDVVITNLDKLKEAEKRRKELWKAMQKPEIRTNIEKYLEALKKYELALKITE